MTKLGINYRDSIIMTGMSNSLRLFLNQPGLTCPWPVDMDGTQEISSARTAQSFIEVYLFGFYRKPRKSQRRENPFIVNPDLMDVDFTKPVFIGAQQAIKYGKCLESNCIILHAIVPDAAIESKNDNLHLRSGYLRNNMFHGYYSSSTEPRTYFKNPFFDQSLLKYGHPSSSTLKGTTNNEASSVTAIGE